MVRARSLLGIAALFSTAILFTVAPGCGSDGGEVAPDETGGGDSGGSDVTLPDGSTSDTGQQGDGSTLPPGAVVLPDGRVLLPDGGVLLPDGGMSSIPDSGIVLPDGGIYLPDGGVVAPPPGCVQTTCQGKIYECGDCIDNDGDGRVDMRDVGCLGPCDNTETDLTLGIPGGNNAPCKADCYFDQDTGSGNDTCIWDHACDPHSTAPNFYPETQSGNKCEYNWQTTKVQGNGTCAEFYSKADGASGQPASCGSFCGPLTPNGCDCFGCCTFPALAEQVETVQPPGVAASKPNYVWLGSLDAQGNPSCTLDKVTDPTKCHSCTPVVACLNTCAPCELCIGKTTLPPECSPPPPPPVQDGGVPVDGGTLQPDGGILLPDGGIISVPDGGVLLPDGGLYLPDGGVVQPDGGSIGPQCGGQICFGGAQACGLDCQPNCPTGQFCLTGCCTPTPK